MELLYYIILVLFIYLTPCIYPILIQIERDYYSKNLSILNILSYRVIETCREMLKFSEHEKLWRYSNYISPSFKIVLKLGIWFPNFILLLNSKKASPGSYYYKNLIAIEINETCLWQTQIQFKGNKLIHICLKVIYLERAYLQS